MPPVGIFKCPHVADNNEDQPPAEERDPTENHEWHTPTRVRVKVLFDDGVPRHEIEKQTNVRVRSQQRISKGPDRRPGKNRPGAPHKLSKRDIRMMVRHLSRSRENGQSTWQQLARDYGSGCRPETVKRALNNEGYHKCNACHVIGHKQHDCRKGRA